MSEPVEIPKERWLSEIKWLAEQSRKQPSLAYLNAKNTLARWVAEGYSNLPTEKEVRQAVSDALGVEDVIDPDNWEEAFPIVGKCKLPPIEVIVEGLLIKDGIHVAAGLFESYKTIAIGGELCAAIRQGRRAFDYFEVKRKYEILYLVPDMPPSLFQDYITPFGLMEDEGFRWQDPESEVFYSVDSPVLQRAVQGKILVLDTMLDYAQIQKAAESGEWITFFKKLRRLINVCGCVAIIMLVHPTKSGARSNTIDPTEYLKDSVTFGGKIDVGFAFSKIEDTSKVLVERIKGRGFKDQLRFTITYLDEDGNSWLDRGRFPVYDRPGECKKKEEQVATKGRKPNPKKDEQTQTILKLRSEGKTFKECAAQAGIPESTARSYYNQINFKGEASND